MRQHLIAHGRAILRDSNIRRTTVFLNIGSEGDCLYFCDDRAPKSIGVGDLRWRKSEMHNISIRLNILEERFRHTTPGSWARHVILFLLQGGAILGDTRLLTAQDLMYFQ
jgi:hypothetical protein